VERPRGGGGWAAEQVPAGRLEAEAEQETGRRAGGGGHPSMQRRAGAQNKKGPLWKQKAV
jgi:hypothetical protein